MFASAIPEPVDENRANEMAGAILLVRNAAQRQRLQHMYQLAEIFAAIFETLPDGSEIANSAVERSGLTSAHEDRGP